MEVKQFCNLLNNDLKIGDSVRVAEGCEPSLVDAESVEWMFEYPGMLPVFRFLLENLSGDCVISEEDLFAFEELSKDQVVNGEDELELALRELKSAEYETDKNTGSIDEEIELLEAAISSEEAYVNTMELQRDKMNMQLAALEDALRKTEEHLCQASVAKQCATGDILKYEKLTENLKELRNVSTKVNTKLEENQLKFDASSVEEYLKKEDEFAVQVNNFVKKYFKSSISAEICKKTFTSNEGELDEIKNLAEGNRSFGEGLSSNRDDGGDSSGAYEEKCCEFDIQKRIFVSSERENIEAKLFLEKEAARSAFVGGIMDQLQKGAFEMRSLEEMEAETEANENKTASLKAWCESVMNKEIMPLIENELSSLHASQILLDDYALKLERQKYFANKQGKLTSLLLSQRARQEILAMRNMAEKEKLSELYVCLSSCLNDLDKFSRENENALDILSSPLLQHPGEAQSTSTTVNTPGNPSRKVVDKRDVFSLSLAKILSEACPSDAHPEPSEAAWMGNRPRSFRECVARADISNKANDLFAKVEESLLNLSAVKSAQSNLIGTTEKKATRLEHALFPDPKDKTHILPKEIEVASEKLATTMNHLVEFVNDVLNSREDKRKRLSQDRLHRIKRELFVHFHNDPSRLNSILDDLKSKIAR
eukprot:Nk52_evm31s2568 gene=Nk52_evmTU31s2568